MLDSRRYKRILVKIGSALLVDTASGLRQQWLSSLCQDIHELMKAGHEILVVSSGAIALGRKHMGLPNRALRLEESQASAAIGQIMLARAYSETLGNYGLAAGQILLTLGDTEERRRYLNARETISTMLRLGAVPIINENDTVATSEIRYGDNDRLAARVATMVSVDLLILLSDVDGFYSGIPGKEPGAKRFERISVITTEMEAMAGDAGTGLSRGGMVTKLEAAKIATQAGTIMAITSGKSMNPLKTFFSNGPATWFDAQENPVTARKKWIAGQIELSGILFIDEGAALALKCGKSLLPAGIRRLEGAFRRGDTVSIRDIDGADLGCGISNYDMDDAKQILGLRSNEIEAVQGITLRGPVIHRDNLVIKDKIRDMEKGDA